MSIHLPIDSMIIDGKCFCDICGERAGLESYYHFRDCQHTYHADSPVGMTAWSARSATRRIAANASCFS